MQILPLYEFANRGSPMRPGEISGNSHSMLMCLLPRTIARPYKTFLTSTRRSLTNKKPNSPIFFLPLIVSFKSAQINYYRNNNLPVEITALSYVFTIIPMEFITRVVSLSGWCCYQGIYTLIVKTIIRVIQSDITFHFSRYLNYLESAVFHTRVNL